MFLHQCFHSLHAQVMRGRPECPGHALSKPRVLAIATGRMRNSPRRTTPRGTCSPARMTPGWRRGCSTLWPSRQCLRRTHSRARCRRSPPRPCNPPQFDIIHGGRQRGSESSGATIVLQALLLFHSLWCPSSVLLNGRPRIQSIWVAGRG